IGGVGLLQTQTLGPVVEEGSIELDKPIPGGSFAGLSQTLQKADLRRMQRRTPTSGHRGEHHKASVAGEQRAKAGQAVLTWLHAPIKRWAAFVLSGVGRN